MRPVQISMIVRCSGVFLLACLCLSMSFAAAPTVEERSQIDMLIGAYYVAVAAENVDEAVDLHHWENSFERDKIQALVEQAFAVADSEFKRVRIQSIDLYPERGIGLARVGVDYNVRSFDESESISGHLDAAIVLKRGSKGWRIGKVGRAADFDLATAVGGFSTRLQELEETVPAAPVGAVEEPSTGVKRPKLATAPAEMAQTPAAGAKTTPGTVAGTPATGGLTFYALSRKTTGECVVVAGAEGISPGDTVYGAFPDFPQAQEAVTAGCSGAQPGPAIPVPAAESGPPLTADRLYEPDDTITRGQWGGVTRIGGNPQFANATEGGRVLRDGFFTHPGNGGATEIVYVHNGTELILRGVATVIDCVDRCGAAGSVAFSILGDGQELWASGLVRHGDPGSSFAVGLQGVREIRLITSDGGNGTAEDWAAWLDLELGNDATQVPAQSISVAGTKSVVASSFLAVPRYEADESTAGAFVIDLGDGSAEFVDRVKVKESTVRRRPMNHNVFAALGRSTDGSANTGEVLAGEIRSTSGAAVGLFLVDTQTGAVAYLDDLVNEPHRATLRRVNGLPAEAIASNDGNFALVMRRGGSGATEGAYLYHATTGECVYFAHVNKMAPDPTAKFVSGMPQIEGRVAAIALQDGGEATTHALLVDEASGAIYMAGGLERDPSEVTVVRQQLGLFEFFPPSPEVASSQRFILVPGFSDNGATDAVFVVDAGTGRMAVLKDVRRRGAMRLVGSTKILFSLLPETDGSVRALAAVPKVGASGTTDGAWIFDSSTETMLVLENVRGPQNLKIHRLEEESK